MNDRQKTFVAEYLIDGNATRAAQAAGYSFDTAYAHGHKLLKNAEISAAIAEGQRKKAEKCSVTAESLMKDLETIKQRCMQGEPVLDSKGVPTGEWKFDSRGALRAAELQGKHIGMFQEDKTQTTLEVSYRVQEDLARLPTARLLEQYFQIKGVDDAVQKQSPNGLDVREQTKNGEAVGQGHARKGFEFTGSQGRKTED